MCARVGRITSQEDIEALLEPFGGVEAALEGLRESEANQQYLEANRGSWSSNTRTSGSGYCTSE